MTAQPESWRREVEERSSALARSMEAVALLEVEVRQLRAALDEERRTQGVIARTRAWLRSAPAAIRGKLAAIPARLTASLGRRIIARRIAATGLFDAEHYLGANADVAASGVDPIRHFVKYGAAQGRDPHPMFDTSYYLRHNPDVARRGINPLLHFALVGAAQGRRPHPQHDADAYLAAAPRGAARRARARELAGRSRRTGHGRSTRVRFAPSLLEGGLPSARQGISPPATTLLVSHVLPCPPRAGNEYRIHRLLGWLRSIGHEVHLIVSPLAGEVVDPERVRRTALEHPNLVVCGRDGTVRYQSERAEVRRALAALAGEESRSFPLTPQPAAVDPAGALTDLERSFCPDHLIDVLLRVVDAVQPDAVVSSYVFMSRTLTALGDGVLKIIDTHDVFSTKSRKVVQFGVRDGLAISTEAEGALLRRADLVIAIQPEEEEELRAIAPEPRTVTAGVDFDVGPPASPAADPVLLYVASDNALNVKGIRDFLALAWPLVRRELPQARLRLVGPVCDFVDGAIEGVELLGPVDSLDEVYAGARAVINPAVAGTGLKIKTLEALSHGRPLVVWPSGVDGLPPVAKRLCRVADDWYAFAHHVVSLLSAEPAEDAGKDREEIVQQLARDAVYRALGAALEEGIRASRQPRRAV